jgi:hypothetical protein
MADGVLAAPPQAEYLCANEWYLWAVQLDYAYWLNGLSCDKRTKHFLMVESIQRDMDYPRPQARCGRCSEVAWELRLPGKREYRCTEETCGLIW